MSEYKNKVRYKIGINCKISSKLGQLSVDEQVITVGRDYKRISRGPFDMGH
jgi:hypothetical protein